MTKNVYFNYCTHTDNCIKCSLTKEMIFDKEHTQMTFFLAAIITQLVKVLIHTRTIVLAHPNKN